MKPADMETTQEKLALGAERRKERDEQFYSTPTAQSGEECAPSSLLLEPGGQVSDLGTPVLFLRR